MRGTRRWVPAGAPIVGGGAAQGGQTGRGGVPRRLEAKSREWLGALRLDEKSRRSVATSSRGESALPQGVGTSGRETDRVSVLGGDPMSETALITGASSGLGMEYPKLFPPAQTDVPLFPPRREQLPPPPHAP